MQRTTATIASLFSRRDNGWSGYQPLDRPDEQPELTEPAAEPQVLRYPRGAHVRRAFYAALIALAFAALTVWSLHKHVPSKIQDVDISPCLTTDEDDKTKGYQCHPDISHHWGQYSPYYTVPSNISAAVPEGCDITFAQVLARHGARDPTGGKTGLYADLIRHIHGSVSEYPGKYEFLRDYEYKLGADQLSIFGEDQLYLLGSKFYERYQSLAQDSLPYVRASGQERVVNSAERWISGYSDAVRKSDSAGDVPDGDLKFPQSTVKEGHAYNNTLSHGLCHSFESGKYANVGYDSQIGFTEAFTAPIRARINNDLRGAQLSTAQITYLMDICPFETVADKSYKDTNFTVPLSPFCRLFTPAEWRAYDYHKTLSKYYGYGPGNPMGSTQGVGFTNELIARLTRSPVVDHTSTNRTFTADPTTFPLNNTLYADFSHDDDMMGIYSAMGLFNATKPLSKDAYTSPEAANGFSAAWAVPFAARMYVEKMTCGGGAGELVRVLLNDRVVPLQNCGADALGRCELGAFVDSLGFAREGGKWDEC